MILFKLPIFKLKINNKKHYRKGYIIDKIDIKFRSQDK